MHQKTQRKEKIKKEEKEKERKKSETERRDREEERKTRDAIKQDKKKKNKKTHGKKVKKMEVVCLFVLHALDAERDRGHVCMCACESSSSIHPQRDRAYT